MGDLSKHFNTAEFACHDGCGFGLGPGDVSPVLVHVLEKVRSHFGQPVHIVSGCRCERHNHAVGGAKHSQHVQGKAADIQVTGVSPRLVAEWLDDQNPGSWGIGRYNTWTHIDVRGWKARWGSV